jgi:hypothetical protein
MKLKERLESINFRIKNLNFTYQVQLKSLINMILINSLTKI